MTCRAEQLTGFYKMGTLGSRMPPLNVNELGDKSLGIIILVKQAIVKLIGLWFSENVPHWSKFKVRSRNKFFL